MTTPDRFVAGAIDLGEVKARAEARAQASHQPWRPKYGQEIGHYRGQL